MDWTPKIGQQVRRKADPATIYKITHIAATGALSGREYRPEITPGTTQQLYKLGEFTMEPADQIEPIQPDQPQPISPADQPAEQGYHAKRMESMQAQIASMVQQITDLTAEIERLRTLRTMAERQRDEIRANTEQRIRDAVSEANTRAAKQSFAELNTLREENKRLTERLYTAEAKPATPPADLNFMTIIQQVIGDPTQADQQISTLRAEGWRITSQTVQIHGQDFTRVIAFERPITITSISANPKSPFFGATLIDRMDAEVVDAALESIIIPAAHNPEAKPA